MACSGCGKRRELGRQMVASVRAGNFADAREQMAKMAESVKADVTKVNDQMAVAVKKLMPESSLPSEGDRPSGTPRLRVKQVSRELFHLDARDKV